MYIVGMRSRGNRLPFPFSNFHLARDERGAGAKGGFLSHCVSGGMELRECDVRSCRMPSAEHLGVACHLGSRCLTLHELSSGI